MAKVVETWSYESKNDIKENRTGDWAELDQRIILTKASVISVSFALSRDYPMVLFRRDHLIVMGKQIHCFREVNKA